MESKKGTKLLDEGIRTFQTLGAIVAGILSWNIDHDISHLIVRTFLGWLWLIYAWFKGML